VASVLLEMFVQLPRKWALGETHEYRTNKEKNDGQGRENEYKQNDRQN
jgi:hypothetical protein